LNAEMLIDIVADLTAVRDREKLETSLSQLLFTQLDARTLTYHRLVPCEGGPRLWPVVRVNHDGVRRLAEANDPTRLQPVEGWRARAVNERSTLRLSARGEPRCCYLLPVLAEREPVGLIEADGVRKMLSPEREIAVETLLRIYRNQLALLDYGEQDTLTSLRNRRTFDSDFARLLREEQAERVDRLDGERAEACHDGVDSRRDVGEDAPHWLAVVDVDRFKRINDEYGHLYGDEVLLLLAQMMRAQFRPVDRLYRFGGEEFVVLLSRTPADAARTPLERLRSAVESRVFSRVGRVTISIGYTQIQLLDDAAGAFGRADAALYHAKQNGRNQVQFWESLVEAGLLESKKTEAMVELF
jgi:diguanylate cyclase (GGDEF)-like protein